MISTLTSLLSGAEDETPETETEATDERVPGSGDGADAVAPDLAVVEPDAAHPPDDEPVSGPDGDGDERPGDADRDPDTDWEFISGMVDQAMASEAAEPPVDPAGTTSPRETGDTDSAGTGPTATTTGDTVGAGPFSGVPLADLNADRTPIVEAEAATGTAGEPRTDDRAAEDDPTSAAVVAGDSVLEALVAELETAELSPSERATLREALGVDSPESVRVRLSHLQSDVADLRAYADAIERVLEEESEADRMARDLGRRIDGLRDRLDEAVTALEDDLTAETAAREADVDRLESRIDGVATTLTDSVMALHHDIEALRDEVETNRAWREDVTAAFANAED